MCQISVEALYYVSTGGYFSEGESAGGVKLTAQSRLESRLRIRGAITSTLQYIFMARCEICKGTTLLLHFLYSTFL
jgi:hypothetical protein